MDRLRGDRQIADVEADDQRREVLFLREEERPLTIASMVEDPDFLRDFNDFLDRLEARWCEGEKDGEEAAEKRASA